MVLTHVMLRRGDGVRQNDIVDDGMDSVMVMAMDEDLDDFDVMVVVKDYLSIKKRNKNNIFGLDKFDKRLLIRAILVFMYTDLVWQFL